MAEETAIPENVRDDYDNPENLWEDNPDWYEDEDEAWDEWENG